MALPPVSPPAFWKAKLTLVTAVTFPMLLSKSPCDASCRLEYAEVSCPQPGLATFGMLAPTRRWLQTPLSVTNRVQVGIVHFLVEGPGSVYVLQEQLPANARNRLGFRYSKTNEAVRAA